MAPATLAVMPGSEPGLFDRVRQKLPESMQAEYGSYLGEYFNFWAAFRRTEAESSAFYGRFARFYGAAANAFDAGGSEDLQPEAVSRAFAAWFPASRFVGIDGAGHFVFNQQPQEFAQAVAEFLRGAAPQAGRSVLEFSSGPFRAGP